MVIGVTGGYCTGKSEAAKNLKSFGAKVIDLDKLAHLTLASKTPAYKKIVREFGRDILKHNRIDRRLLAKRVFGDKKMLEKLNSIIHPVVIRQMKGLIRKFSRKYRVVVVEAPLLFEAGLKKYFDYVVVVKANRRNQIIRAERKSGFCPKEIAQRIRSQWPLEKKAVQADFIIDNNKSIKEVRRQTRKIWDNLISQ